GISGSGATAPSFFAVLVRRGAAPVEPLTVGGFVDLEGGGGGCGGTPDPPTVKTTTLGGAPPITKATSTDASDAGADASDAGLEASKLVPSCENLKAQIDACDKISQDAKDSMPAFCAGVSEACRACLDGTLCGVTEQCDPVCGKK